MLCFFTIVINGFSWSIVVMLRLISLSSLVLCLALFTGCKMCASHTDIVGSPVPNAASDGYHRAGSYYGGYSGGGVYYNGYPVSSSPQRVYDSEFSRGANFQNHSGGTIQTAPAHTTMSTQSYNSVVPAVIRSEYSPVYANEVPIH